MVVTSTDFIGVTLSALKFIGVIVSGIGAVLAAIPETDSKAQKKDHEPTAAQSDPKAAPLTPPSSPGPAGLVTRILEHVPWAGSRQAALNLAIVGLIVATLSQFIESIKSASEAREQSQRYAAQMDAIQNQTRTAAQSLEALNRMMTRFDGMRYDSQFVLPSSDQRVAALIAEMQAVVQNGLPPGSIPPERFTLQKPAPGKALITLILPLDIGRLTTLFPSIGALQPVWDALPLGPTRLWINKKAKTAAEVTAVLSANSDLTLFNVDRPAPPMGVIYYFESERRLYVQSLDFACTVADRSCWNGNDSIVGIYDLANAYVIAEVDWLGDISMTSNDPILSATKPDYLHFEVNRSSIFLSKFHVEERHPPRPSGENPHAGFYVYTEFPGEQDILQNKEALPPQRMRSDP
jgi:hypothetical protein